MNLFGNEAAAAPVLPPECIQHFGKKKPHCEGCGGKLGVDRPPVAGMGKWFCTDWCRDRHDVEALPFAEAGPVNPAADGGWTPTEEGNVHADEWDDIAYDEAAPVATGNEFTDAVLRAREIGRQSASIPQWSEASKKRLGSQMTALMLGCSDDEQHALAAAYDDAHQAERRRRLQEVAAG